MSSQNPFFSIIIPTYNRAYMIEKSINSIVSQTYTNWELIIVDDGSTDNTKEVVGPFIENDKRINYIYQNNAERSVARNNGIKNASGEFICFLDSDDYYLSNRLELLYQYLIDKNELFYYTGIKYDYGSYIEDIPQKTNLNLKIVDFLVSTTIGTPQVCIHKSLFNNNKFDDRLNIGEDMELWLRISQYALPKYIDNQATIIATHHEERSVNFIYKNSGILLLKTLKVIFSKNHPGRNITSKYKKQLISNCYFTIFKYWVYNNNRIYSLYYIFRTILADLGNIQLKYRINILLHILRYKRYDKVIQLLSS